MVLLLINPLNHRSFGALLADQGGVVLFHLIRLVLACDKEWILGTVDTKQGIEPLMMAKSI